MGIDFSILWRVTWTVFALMFLASCGTERPVIAPPPPTQGLDTGATAPPTHTAPSQVATSPATPSTASSKTVQAPTATSAAGGNAAFTRTPVLTITLANDNQSLTLQAGDRFLLDLGPSFEWKVNIEGATVLRQIPTGGTKDNQGLYEAVEPGNATLTAIGNPLCYNAVPRYLMPSVLFTLHVTVAGGSSSMPTLTLADQGKTISLTVGQTVLVNLGDDYTWTINVQDPTILRRVANTSVAKGAQGVYEAARPGTTTLTATGGINCPPQKACIMIAREFSVQIIVR